MDEAVRACPIGGFGVRIPLVFVFDVVQQLASGFSPCFVSRFQVQFFPMQRYFWTELRL